MLFDDLPVHQMLLDDPLENRRITSTVPSAFGIDHRDGSPFADSEAIRLGAKDASLLGETKLLETLFQIVPGGDRSLPLAALGLGLITAQKDVPTGEMSAH